MKLWRLAERIVLGQLPGGSRYCVLCNQRVWKFLPYAGGSSSMPALMRELHVVGSDVDNFSCPRCNGHDRERHLLMFLWASDLLATMRSKDILHFAPERRLSQWIAKTEPGRYVRCDLEPHSPDICRIDMLSIDADSASFDFVIANHVLEHVADDKQALHEVSRVLKIGGYAILQTPFAKKLHSTWEDRGITDGASRLQAYGQADHVRLYGRDIFDRIAAFDLEPLIRQHFDLLASKDAASHGVNSEEPFFLFRKMAPI
jgi:SAM-dependent methyltransferase